MIPNLSRLTTQGRFVRTQQTQRKFRAFEELETPYLIPEAQMPQIPALKDIDMLDLDEKRPDQELPSPVYQSDFFFLEEKTPAGAGKYLPTETQQTQLKPQEYQAITVQPVVIDSQIYLSSLEYQQRVPIQETQIDAMQEFENQLKQEQDLQSLKQELKERDDHKLRVESAVHILEQTRVEKINDTRSKIQPMIPQSELSLSSNFFEFQPHLIYQERKPVLPQSIQSIKALVPLDSKDAGILPDVGIGYTFDNATLHLWRLSNPVNTQRTLPAFPSKLLSIKSIQDQKSSNLLLILTTEEIHLYQIKHNADQSFNLTPYVEPVSTDRTRYFTIYQTQSKQVFIGGDHRKVSELKIEGVNNNPVVVPSKASKSKSQMVLKYLKGKIIGEKSKMRKVDKSMSTEEESMIKKIIGNFFDKKMSVTRIVTTMIEDISNKCLIVAVSDSSKSSDIEFYDISKEELKLIHKISLSEIFEELKKRAPINGSPTQHIFKLSIINNELTIFFITGPSISIKISYSSGKVSYSVISALTPPFELIIDRYESLFDSDFIPDQLDEYQPWKPLTSKPSYITSAITIGQQAEIIDTEMFEDGRIVMLIKDISKALDNNKNYIVLIQPNYRRGPLYKYSQYLLGVSEITGCKQCFALSLSKNAQGRLTVQVLTDHGQQTYLIPNNEDILLQYLDLLVNIQLNFNKSADSESIVQRVKKDFEAYISGQDIQVTLEALLKIILARGRQNCVSEQYYRSEFALNFYKNYDKMMKEGQPFGGQMSSDPHLFRINLRKVALYVKQYLFQNDRGSLFQVSSDHVSLALKYFFDLSTTADHFPCNLVSDRTFLHAYRDYQHYISQKSLSILETERLSVIYRELEVILRKVWGRKIIKEGEKGQAETGLTLGETDVTSQRLRFLGKFIHDNLIPLQTVSIESDYFPPNTTGVTAVPKNLKIEVKSLIDLVVRLSQGLELLKDHVYQDKVLKSLAKDITKQVAKCNFSDYLIQGFQNQEVCQLFESTIIQLDAREIQNSSQKSDFLTPNALSIFLAKKYLQAAKALQNMKTRDDQALQSMKLSAHQEFMKFPLKVNYPVALPDYITLNMVLEAVTLCLKCIDTVEDIRNLVKNSQDQKDDIMKNVLMTRQGQQDAAIKGIVEILNEVIMRIEIAEGRFKTQPKQPQKDSLIDRLRKRLADQSLSVDYLKDLKKKILHLSTSSRSEFFHVQLYELLLSYGLFQDVKSVQNPSIKSVVKQLKLEPDSAASMTDDQKQNLAKGKLEATFSHYVNANLYGQAFIEVMDQICFAKQNSLAKIDIKDRILWLQKAEGSLVSFQNQMDSKRKGTIEIAEEVDIQEELIKQLYLFKDYFLVLFQLRDAASVRIQSQKKAAKLDPNIVQKLTYEIVEPNELCQIAIQLKQWIMYLRILEINEIYSYQSNGKVQVSYRTQEENKGTQDRIDFMYRVLLSGSTLFSILQSQRKYSRLVSNLKQLHDHSTARGLEIVNMFPENLILTILEDQNQENLIAQRSDDFYKQVQHWDDIWDSENKLDTSKQINLFWHLDLLISDLGFNADRLFDTLYSRLAKGIDPEMYLSLAYLIIKFKVGADSAIRRLKVMQLVDWLSDAISDELVFPKNFIEKLKIVIEKLNSRLHPALQQKAVTLVVEEERQQFIPQQ